jgi:ABC-type sugar transport system ATPase subunit
MQISQRGAAGAVSSREGQPPLVRVTGATKSFPGVRALDGVDLEIRAGEVHALTGENGSGKSTLARALAGMVPPDAGTIEIDGVPTAIPDPRTALELGIVLISQELTLAPTLTVAENVFLGRLPRTRLGTVDWARLRTDARKVLDRLGVHVDVERRVGDLTLELQQEVEIARAMSTDARLLILDEATSSLSEAATDRLLTIVEEQRDAGVAVLTISHRMPELYRVASVATVLRDGRLMGSYPLPETTEHELVARMVGRELSDFYGKRSIPTGDVVLDVEDLETLDGQLRPTTLQVRAGEIVGVAGLVGSGKAELGLALGGAVPARGRVSVRGRPVRLGDPRGARGGGIGFVPDDRKAGAIFPTRSVGENFAAAWIERFSRAGLVDARAERGAVREAIDRYGVVTASEHQSIATLSGGNQQKVVLGRVFALGLDVLVLSEPTRGVDVGAKAAIYQLMQDAAEQGAAVIVISSELPELLGISDRLLVFSHGTIAIAGELVNDAELDEETVAHIAVTGQPPVAAR